MKSKRILALALVMVLAIGCLVGCEKKTVESSLPYAVNEMDVDVIDELPDWSGEKLDLTLWWGHGVNHVAIGKKKTDDKFQSEFARVTGITFNEKESFDNGGVSADSKIARIVASNKWPHIATDIGGEILEQLVEQDLIYDLTDLIPKYMPNYMSYVNSNDELRAIWERQGVSSDGRKYRFSHLGNNVFMFSDPEFTPDKYPGMTSNPDSRGFIYVRDDILKAVRPEAHTVKELQDIYMAKGEFTESEITDYTINSLDELRTLLEDIKALGVKENGREVWPIYTYDGADNWSLLSQAAFFSGTGHGSPNTYFIYYDAKEDKLKNPVKEEWYKEYVKFWNKLYRDGLASEEAFIDNKATFDQKRNNGEYAIFYGLNAPPTQDALKAGGKDYAYRKVYVDIPTDKERFGNARTVSVHAGNMVSCVFFKNMLNESQLEQVLRAIDFAYTDAGMKFAQWGSKKAGLYEEKEDGTFMFVDKKVENAIAYDGDRDILCDYGYESFPPISVFVGNDTTRLNKFHEQIVYQPLKDLNRSPENYLSKFNYTYVEPVENLPTLDFMWHIYNFASDVEGIKSMWAARQGVEDAFTHCLAAKSDAEFEKAWEELIAYEERNGYTDEALEEANKVFVEKNGGNISGLLELG